jgi:DNA-3-methyladenine glycosylase II
MVYELASADIARALDALASDHGRIARALAQVGYPEERRRDHSFATLARIVVGQQVSVAAASSITRKLVDTLDGDLTCRISTELSLKRACAALGCLGKR